MTARATGEPYRVEIAPTASQTTAPTVIFELFARGAQQLARRLATAGSEVERVVEFAPTMCAYSARVLINPLTRTVSLLAIQRRAAA